MPDTRLFIRQLYRKWLRWLYLEQLLYAFGWALLVYGVLDALIVADYPVLLPIIAGLSVALIFHTPSIEDLCNYLDQEYIELEHSSSLLLKKTDGLGALAAMQQVQTLERFQAIQPKLPHQWGRTFLALGLGLIVFYALPSFTGAKGTTSTLGKETGASSRMMEQETNKSYEQPSLESLKLNVQPPAYTRLAPFESEDIKVEVPYYSRISWKIEFSGKVQEAKIVFDGQEELTLQVTKQPAWIANTVLKQNRFYHILFLDMQGNWNRTDYFQLQLKKDFPAEIEVVDLPQYAEYIYTEEKRIRFRTHIQDDYGVQAAWIIATLSKGEGESVTFKNDTIPFEENFSRTGRAYTLEKELALNAIGMEPGDELYLHIEAIDNRNPKPQRTKTYKYIVAFEDTTQISMEMYGRLAIDRMPDYFRSQRQIIIDTEKLIAQRSKLAAKEFQNKSNAIGADQKLLRLRYGQFLGEEFETNIGHIGKEEEEHEHEEDEHIHDENCEHGHIFGYKQVQEKKHVHTEDCEHEDTEEHHEHEHAHDHGHEHSNATEGDREAKIEEALLPYYHVHDIAEEVTYFDEATSAKLRAALTQMWDAELHLRMGRPEQALPYEYKALKLIKEVQQASRIYVERVGFEPPEIKVGEKRLSGELNAIQSPQNRYNKKQERNYPNMEASLPILENLKQAFRHPTNEEQKILQAAGEELASVVLKQEQNFLLELQQLRSLLEKQIPSLKYRATLQAIQAAFSWVLPKKEQAQKQVQTKSKLQELYLKAISD